MSSRHYYELVIADSSPLVAITIMDLFPQLNRLFNKVIIPHEVYSECVHDLSKPQAKSIVKAIKEFNYKKIKTKHSANYQLLQEILDPGEAAAITLAKELHATVLIDEAAGRKVAKREGIYCIGSLFVLIKSKQNRYINSVIPPLTQLVRHGYYIKPDLIETALEISNQLSQENIDLIFSKNPDLNK